MGVSGVHPTYRVKCLNGKMSLTVRLISVATLSLLSMSLVLIQQEFTLGVVVLRAANKDMIGTS